MAQKWVYFFGGGQADGKSEMKNLLAAKAQISRMVNIGLPVPQDLPSRPKCVRIL
jgi:pyruvate,orthophosphate dikinase